MTLVMVASSCAGQVAPILAKPWRPCCQPERAGQCAVEKDGLEPRGPVRDIFGRALRGLAGRAYRFGTIGRKELDGTDPRPVPLLGRVDPNGSVGLPRIIQQRDQTLVNQRHGIASLVGPREAATAVPVTRV